MGVVVDDDADGFSLDSGTKMMGGGTKDILVVVISIGRDHSEIMSLFMFLNYSHFVVRFPNMVHKGRFLLDRSSILHGMLRVSTSRSHMDTFTVIAINHIK